LCVLTVGLIRHPLTDYPLFCACQVIIGRTDSAQVLGMEEAVVRLKLAAHAGADVCFIEGVKSKDLLESTVKALAPKPVCPPPRITRTRTER
jgi:2-methylisocitrate lyase-like PEP mutase family enzyme